MLSKDAFIIFNSDDLTGSKSNNKNSKAKTRKRKSE